MTVHVEDSTRLAVEALSRTWNLAKQQARECLRVSRVLGLGQSLYRY